MFSKILLDPVLYHQTANTWDKKCAYVPPSFHLDDPQESDKTETMTPTMIEGGNLPGKLVLTQNSFLSTSQLNFINSHLIPLRSAHLEIRLEVTKRYKNNNLQLKSEVLWFDLCRGL